MTYEQFILDIYVRLFQQFELVLKGLTNEELNYQPDSHSNSIGWLAWHTIRSQDRLNADLFGEEQLWISEKWYLKFNRKADPKETGNGHTAAQVAEFRAPDIQTYLDYYKAVFERTKIYITTRLSPTDLQREVTSPTLGNTVTVESRLLGTINNYQHVGQAGYVKGMLKGIGWYGR
jgi:DinB superfamily